MSLVGTLGKIAVGVMVAKGATSLLKNAGGGQGGGLAGGLGGLLGGNAQQGGQAGGGLAGGLGGLLGGNAQQGGQAGGGLAGGLGGLLGGNAQQGGQAGGGLAGGLGGLLGGAGQQGGAAGGAAGGLGGLLESLGGGGAQQGGQAGGGLGGFLNEQLTGNEPAAPAEPTAQQEEEARILITAMLNSAKADGNLDATEQEKILKQIGDMSQEDADFVNAELAKPLDAAGFIQSVPRGMEQQVYMMSLLAIDLDTQAEAQYLDQLAKGLNISNQQSNEIHAQVGVPALYG